MDIVEAVEIDDANVERDFELGAGSWIVIRLTGTPDTSAGNALQVSVVSGERPLWEPAFTIDGKISSYRMFHDNTVRMKTRAGQYRIRFDVRSGSRTNSPPLVARELDVTVPGAGEVVVTIEAP